MREGAPTASVLGAAGAEDRNRTRAAASHLYVHIPFCRTRCAYCDFYSESIKGHDRAGRVEEYVEALRAEARTRAGLPGARPLASIYLGGGTPTVLPRDLLLRLVRDLVAEMEEGGEFTVEANPGTVDSSLLAGLAEAGVTRLSLGVQSFAPAPRAGLGRRVTQEEIEAALAAIVASGWRDWNLDLIFGIPGQSWPEAASDLEAAVQAGPTHISLYDLTYTSAFAKRVDRMLGAAARTAAHEMAERHYAEGVLRLEAAGYLRYEISNFALPGYECRHNQAYWRGEDYWGIGAGAVSTLGGRRYTNARPLVEYLEGCPPEVEPLSAATRLWERAMLGLRTREGVDEESVHPVLDHAACDRLLAQGYLERRYGKLRVNPGFLNVSNTVIGTLLASPGGS